MADHSRMKLGRHHVRLDMRTLPFNRYAKALPPPPAARDWTKGISAWGMMLNDQLGCCTISGCGHAVQAWSANSGLEITPSDADILNYYEGWDGYTLGDPSTDNGGCELDVLNAWRKQGFAGHGLLGYADPQVSNLNEVRQAIDLFGGVYIGLSLPVEAQSQDVWDTVAGMTPGSWGGHCVFVPKYDAENFTCVTWGQLKTMTVAFWNQCCDEAHALFGADWLGAKGSPEGFDQAQLLADLKEMAM